MQRAYEVLHNIFGHSLFKGQQQEIIRHIIQGGHALVLMPTGGGKSLCYLISALVRDGVAVVVSPLIDLMHDQVQQLQALGVRAVYLNSSLDLPDLQAGEYSLRPRELALMCSDPGRFGSTST